MKVLICGDRNWTDGELIHHWLLKFHGQITCVIEGEAKGADKLGRMAAEKLGIPVDRYPADWNKEGKKAGILRNYQMLQQGNPDIVLAFHDNLAESKGTGHMVKIARLADIPVVVVTH